VLGHRIQFVTIPLNDLHLYVGVVVCVLYDTIMCCITYVYIT